MECPRHSHDGGWHVHRECELRRYRVRAAPRRRAGARRSEAQPAVATPSLHDRHDCGGGGVRHRVGVRLHAGAAADEEHGHGVPHALHQFGKSAGGGDGQDRPPEAGALVLAVRRTDGGRRGDLRGHRALLQGARLHARHVVHREDKHNDTWWFRAGRASART